MIFFLIIFISLIFFVVIMARKYRNPYKLILVFGKKGSGKTTLLVKKAIQYIRKGKEVYSTVYVPGTHLFDVQEVGQRTFPRESVVFIDEVGMIWDNRNFKAFRTDVRDWFKLQRHHHVTVWLFSQTNDIDKKLRDLMDEMYLCTCHMNFISIARKIKRSITIVHPSGDAEARIADDIDFVPVWYSLFGAKSALFTYIPNWVRFFDSFEVPPLPIVNSEYQDIPDAALLAYHPSRLHRVVYGLFNLIQFLSMRAPVALAGRAHRKKNSRKRKHVHSRKSKRKFTDSEKS